MDRKKQLRTQDKNANAIGIGYSQTVSLEGSTKPLPSGEVIKIVNQAEQFFLERKESNVYRFTATVAPLIYYPQDYYWIGATINPDGTLVETDSTVQTSPWDNVTYTLPNILTPQSVGGDPTFENLDVSKTSNWVGHLIYPYENDYLKLYTIPEFTADLMYAPSIESTRYGIDTGINDILYKKIVKYLDDNLDGMTISEWFNGGQHILEEPIWQLNQEGDLYLPFSTLKINNQGYKGYTQDGVPFLFSVPVVTEQGWYTALYTPFEHNFEEDDFIFVKPIATIGYETPNELFETCDPTLYGFKRVIAKSWDALGDKYAKNYIIIEHKSEKQWSWITNDGGLNTEGEDYPWTVESSQGFVKRVSNYSPELIKSIVTEPLNLQTFSIIAGQPNVILITLVEEDHGLKEGDQVLITITQDALGTEFIDYKKPSLFNLSGIYKVDNVDSPFTFTIRAREIQDNIPFHTQTLGQLVISATNYYIQLSKVESTPSEYYLRKGKIINSINNFEINKLPFSNSIYNDSNYNVVIDEDIDISKIKDNYGKPISELYLMITKRAGQKTYDFTDVESFFSWKFNYSAILVKTGDGLDVVSKRSIDPNISGHVKNVSGGFMSEYDSYLGDWYYIDFTEYNNTQLLETRIERLKNRFNTIGRECPNENCDTYLIGEEGGMNISSFTVDVNDNWGEVEIADGGDQGLQLISDSGYGGNYSYSNFVYTTFYIPEELCNFPDNDPGLLIQIDYTQVSTIGYLKIVDPSNNIVWLQNGGSNGITLGSQSTMGDINANQSSTNTATFNPTTPGFYKIYLGISNNSGSYSENTGENFTGPYTAYFNNLQIIRFFGTPKYGGWVYDPLGDYKIKQWSSYIETADPTVLGIPYWAQDVDGLKVWRELLDVGYFEDVNRTLGVDYPFLNGKHYLNIDKTLSVGITPSKTSENTYATVIYGCQQNFATNYNPFATQPCGSNVEQGGPCVGDQDGVMQSDIPGYPGYNSFGCCCQYGNSTNTENTGSAFAAALPPVVNQYVAAVNETTGLPTGPSPLYRRGDYAVGWNSCRGPFPYWKEATYYGQDFEYWDMNCIEHPHVNYGNTCGVVPTNMMMAGVMTGLDNPAFSSPNTDGEIAYDVFRYENFVSWSEQFLTLYGTSLGNESDEPMFSENRGKLQQLHDQPVPTMITYQEAQQMQTIKSNPPETQWSDYGYTPTPGIGEGPNGTSKWTENIIDTSGKSGKPYYFDHDLFEFYKFDTSQCFSCYDKGGPAGYGGGGTSDYFAPRHGWPSEVDSDGNINNPEGIPKFQTEPPLGQREVQVDGFGDTDGLAGILRPSIYGTVNSGNIAGHHLQNDPDNWRFFYANCALTWACPDNYYTNPDSSIGYPWPDSTWNGSGGGNYDAYDVETAIPTITWVAGDGDNPQGSGLYNAQPTQKTESRCTNLVLDAGNKYRNYGNGIFDNLETSYETALACHQYSQPTYFEPDIPVGEQFTYEFRGRVNIEMAVNYDGYESWYVSDNIDRGWALAGPNVGAPPIVWNNPNATMGAGAPPDGAKTLAANMAQTDGYKKYTRLYAGFWIGIVSERCSANDGPGKGTEKCTYIYDPDDGTAGGSEDPNNNDYQSDGFQDTFTNKKWNHYCGGMRADGLPASNKMAYSPCRDKNSNYEDCDMTDIFDISYDPINYLSSGLYAPSCGEDDGTGQPVPSTKEDFQKLWSQSFKSAPIPMHEGDKAFIFIKTVGGTLRDNNVAINGYGAELYNVPLSSGGSILNEVDLHLPTYWAARNVSQGPIY